MKTIKVESIEYLRELLSIDVHDYFIRLNGGLRSSKHIWDEEDGEIMTENFIDGSVCKLSETNVPKAIAKGAFFAELWED